MRQGILIYLLCTVQLLIAQQEEVDFTPVHRLHKDAFSFSLENTATKELGFFIKSNPHLSAYLLNEKHEIINQFATEDQKIPVAFKKFKKMIGGVVVDQQYRFFLTDNQEENYCLISFDFATQNISYKALDLKFKKERLIQSIYHDQKLIIITILKNSSTLHFYEIDGTNQPIKHTIALNDQDFIKKGLFVKNLHRLLTKSSRNMSGTSTSVMGFTVKSTGINMPKIEERNPNPIGTTTAQNKLYLKDDTAILTFDGFADETISVEVDLNNYTHTLRHIPKPYMSEQLIKRTPSNSFLFEEHLYQIVSRNEALAFEVKKYPSAEVVYSEYISKQDSISFKNTPILQTRQTNSMTPVDRSMEKTAKFLRKISLQKNGISVYRLDNNLLKITLGGEQVTKSSYYPQQFGLIGIATTTAISYAINPYHNPLFYSYYTDQTVKTVWVDCLFDNALVHQTGTVPTTLFDKVKKIQKQIKRGYLPLKPKEDTTQKQFARRSNTPMAENIFWHNNTLLYGYYLKKDKTYRLHSIQKNTTNQ